MPGARCNSSDVAVFNLMGAGDGFLFASGLFLTAKNATGERFVQTNAPT